MIFYRQNFITTSEVEVSLVVVFLVTVDISSATKLNKHNL